MPTFPTLLASLSRTFCFPLTFPRHRKLPCPFAVALARTYSSTLLITHAIPPEPFLEVVTDSLACPRRSCPARRPSQLDEFTHTQSLANTP